LESFHPCLSNVKQRQMAASVKWNAHHVDLINNFTLNYIIKVFFPLHALQAEIS